MSTENKTSANPVIVERTIDAPVEIVWQAITDKDRMKEWYFNLEDFRPEVGFEFRFPGQGRKGESYLHICKVTEVIPLRKLTYSWNYQGYEGMSKVTFELTEESNRTKLKLTHQGLETFPKHPDFSPESFMEGWTGLIGTSLKNYLEK